MESHDNAAKYEQMLTSHSEHTSITKYKSNPNCVKHTIHFCYFIFHYILCWTSARACHTMGKEKCLLSSIRQH